MADPIGATDSQAPDPRTDHRKGPRRRGAALHRAIFEATLDELAEVGYAGLTMERIAERSRTSKASLYRRWPSRAELVVDAVRSTYPDRDELPDTGDLRADILGLLRLAADRIAGPAGEAARGLIVETLRDPELTRAARERMIQAHPQPMLHILRRAAARGHVRREALTPRIANVGTALLQHHFLIHGAPVPDAVIVEIVDDVVLPLVRSVR
jgi:AcrR family transcriptional regulator